MTGELALFGGEPTRPRPFPPHPVLGDEERDAVLAVLDKGRLSAFIAGPGQFFLGGEHIQEFERRFAASVGKAHAVSFNSATAALHAAVVAVGVEPGAEVIVPPYTFTSTATCALMNNSIPVFADVEPDFYCLSPATFERTISDLTQAVIPVHLFGQAADMDGIMEVARARGIKVIEDCAQAPGAHYKGRPLGTMGDCGIFSFTESKTMTTGEGGMLVTDDPDIAAIAQMVRNHGEVVAPNQTARTYRADLLGWNYRMTELDAAIGIVQLEKLPDLNRHRQMLADHLTKGLASLPGLDPPETRAGCDHVYFVYAMRFDAAAAGLSRKDFVSAMAAEGIPMAPGYVRPLYLNPIYHERRPAAFRLYTGNASYDKGLCPVAERLHEQDLVLTGVARPPATTEDMDDILAAAEKVLAARDRFSA